MLTYVGESERERARGSESPSPGLQSQSDRERLLKIQPTCNLRTYKQPTCNLRRRTSLSRDHRAASFLPPVINLAHHCISLSPLQYTFCATSRPISALRISAKADHESASDKITRVNRGGSRPRHHADDKAGGVSCSLLASVVLLAFVHGTFCRAHASQKATVKPWSPSCCSTSIVWMC